MSRLRPLSFTREIEPPMDTNLHQWNLPQRHRARRGLAQPWNSYLQAAGLSELLFFSNTSGYRNSEDVSSTDVSEASRSVCSYSLILPAGQLRKLLNCRCAVRAKNLEGVNDPLLPCSCCVIRDPRSINFVRDSHGQIGGSNFPVRSVQPTDEIRDAIRSDTANRLCTFIDHSRIIGNQSIFVNGKPFRQHASAILRLRISSENENDKERNRCKCSDAINAFLPKHVTILEFRPSIYKEAA